MMHQKLTNKKLAYLFLLLAILPLFILVSCSHGQDKKMSIVVHPWIGYTPLSYAKEMQWLDDQVNIMVVDSFESSIKMFETGLADAMGMTQVEFQLLSQNKALSVVTLFNRSAGGDAVLSNVSLDQLKQTNQPIPVYLEKGSINELMLDYFINNNQLDEFLFHKIHLSQTEIANLSLLEHPAVLISYTPYIQRILSNGYQALADSADEGYEIFDVLVVNQKTLIEQNKRLKNLDQAIAEAIKVLKKDPKVYYEKIKRHLDAQTYEQFIQDLNGIEWIHRTQNDSILKGVERQKLPLQDLVYEI